MTTKEISYRTENNLFGEPFAKGVLIFLSEKELDNIKNLQKAVRVPIKLIESLLERVKPAKKVDPEYPDEIYTTIIYQKEYSDAVLMMTSFANELGKFLA